VVFDQARVLADQIVGQLVDRRRDRMRTPFDDRLTPATMAFVGLGSSRNTSAAGR